MSDLRARAQGVVGLCAAVKMVRLMRSRVFVGESGESGDELQEDPGADVGGPIRNQEVAELW